MAVGALMGVRRCTEREAFDVIVEAMQATGLGPGVVSQALINVVAGVGPAVDPRAVAYWADVIGSR